MVRTGASRQPMRRGPKPPVGPQGPTWLMPAIAVFCGVVVVVGIVWAAVLGHLFS